MQRAGGMFNFDGSWTTLNDEKDRDDGPKPGSRSPADRRTGHRREFEPSRQRRQSFAERKELALSDVAVFPHGFRAGSCRGSLRRPPVHHPQGHQLHGPGRMDAGA